MPRQSAFALWAYPFRVFFLSTAGAALVLVPLWIGLRLHGSPQHQLAALLWHQHEMTVGLLNAAIAGFLLTAVCNWTRTPPLAGGRLLALWALWLGGRLAPLLPTALQPLALGLDLAFLPAVAAIMAQRVISAGQWRQLGPVAVLALLWALDLSFHLYQQPQMLHALLLAATVLMLVIGGRITPAFTANWLQRQGGSTTTLRRSVWLDRLGILAALAVLAAQLLLARGWLPAALGAVAALVTLVRLAGWRSVAIRREPLLWVLHLGHLWIVVGYALWALARLPTPLVTDNAWLHALGAGAMATLILGVITRVSMGHTGRPLQLLPGMVWGYWALQGAALVRVLAALGWLPWLAGISTAAALWTLAWMLLLWRYAPVLWSPRADGRPG